MKLIVGLGNPGRKYEQTRHNVGFMVAAKVAALIGASPSKVRFEGEIAEGVDRDADEKLVILWPHTYMNASGRSVRKACDFYKLSPDDLLVICDDLNLAAGRLRLRASGSAGGQKGIADIIRHLGTDSVARLRIGIDRPPQGWDASDYVLGKFANEEKDKIETCTTDAAHAAIDWATKGIAFAMNRYNADPAPPKKTNKKTASDKAADDDNLSTDNQTDRNRERD
jgi:PTH1 family peptidyl-tRNA hydrolase